ncbi:hypothetical protein BTR22_04720 [Alkalihalophilus pseudofirmus]|uniref:SulP family inorganic anion transporter n=1 Tax=Alkalihalophilus pseudofirmus TaxID=79885 RepID=UPI0009516CBC|nr:hypothetical protein BTR22_04720 [Alkalihalophilus pseudofirmus]
MIPLLNQFHNYRVKDVKSDLFAAMMVASLLVPQSMAYALLAGLPPVYGFYSAIIPLFVYGVFGPSRQLSVGPVAVLSIMTFTTVSTLAPIGSPLYLQLVIMTTLLTGLLQLGLSICRAGTLIKWIPGPVISGFTLVLALTIILNQLQHIGNVSFNKELPFFFAVLDFIHSIHLVDWATLLFSSFLFIIYFVTKHTASKLPAVLWLLAAGIIVTYVMKFDRKGLPVVGEVTSAMPAFIQPAILIEYLPALLPLAVMIALIGYMESIAMVNQLNKKRKEQIKPNQELFTLGLANTIGSFFCCFPVAGAFSRSAVNADSGAKSGLASIFCAVFLLIILTLFTGLFAYLPMAALAIIIIVAAVRLVDVNMMLGRKIDRKAYGLFVMTAVGCGVFGLIEGFVLGVVMGVGGRVGCKDRIN